MDKTKVECSYCEKEVELIEDFNNEIMCDECYVIHGKGSGYESEEN